MIRIDSNNNIIIIFLFDETGYTQTHKQTNLDHSTYLMSSWESKCEHEPLSVFGCLTIFDFIFIPRKKVYASKNYLITLSRPYCSTYYLRLCHYTTRIFQHQNTFLLRCSLQSSIKCMTSYLYILIYMYTFSNITIWMRVHRCF